VAYRKSSVNLVKDAYQSFRKKRYKEAMLLCEKISAAHPHEPYPLFLLALCHLYTDRFDRADQVINRLQRLSPDYIPMVQLKAFLSLKSALNLDSALSVYIDLLDRYPWDPCLIKGRKMLGGDADFPSLQKKVKLTDLVSVPKPPGKLGSVKRSPAANKGAMLHAGYYLKRVAVITVPLVLLSSGVYLLYPELVRLVSRRPVPEKRFPQLDDVNISATEYDLIRTINNNKNREFYYSVSELTDDFSKAKKYIKQEEYNSAVVILNRMRHSNASFSVKEKAAFLIDFVRDAENRTYDRLAFSTVAEKRYLYHAYSVCWTGKVANLKKMRDSVSFTLLVDYRKAGVFSGVADVYAPGKGLLENGDMVEVDGLIMDVTGNDRPYVAARGVRKIK